MRTLSVWCRAACRAAGHAVAFLVGMILLDVVMAVLIDWWQPTLQKDWWMAVGVFTALVAVNADHIRDEDHEAEGFWLTDDCWVKHELVRTGKVTVTAK